jgi:hypothetical protein
MSTPLTDYQTALIDLPLAGRVFLEGPAGAGKTTAASGAAFKVAQGGRPRRLDPGVDAAAHAGSALRDGAAPLPAARRRLAVAVHGRRPGPQDGGAVLAAGGRPGRLRRSRSLAHLPDPGDGPVPHGQSGAAAAGRRLLRVDHRRPQPALQPDHRQSEQGGGGRLPSLGDQPAAGQGVGGGSRPRRGSIPTLRSAPTAFAATAWPTTCWISRCKSICSGVTCGRCPSAAST